MELAIKIENVAKTLLPGSVFDLFLWHQPSGGTRRAGWHRRSLHTTFHIEFLHQFPTCPSVSAKSSMMDTIKQPADPHGGLRRGAAILHVSTLLMVRKDAPAHMGSFSRSPALLRRLHVHGKWHRIECAASGADGGAEATLISHFSCMPFSCDQKLLLTCPLPIFAENNRRKTPSLDELKHLSAFADKVITGQWTNSMGKCHLQADLDHLLGGIFFD